MDVLQETEQLLKEEHDRLASDGTKIGYAIDHYGLTIERLLNMARRVELTEVSVVDFLMSAEEKFGDVTKAVEHLEEYTAEQIEISKQERLKQYQAESCGGYLDEFKRSIERSKNRRPIQTGFKTLSDVLDGGLYEGLYIVGAIPSLGKTTLIMQMADHIARNGHDVLIFSLEMGRNELMARSISRLTEVKYDDLDNDQSLGKTARGISEGCRYEKYSQKEMAVIERAFQEYSLYADHLYVIEGMGKVGVTQIREQVERHIEITGNQPVVVVDYLQILAPYDVRASDKQNIDKATLELKRLSRDFHLSVIGISSFNRSNYNEKVGFAAFKESGSIEYGADVVIGLQLAGAGTAGFDSTEAKNKHPREVEAIILKNRSGKTGDTIQFSYFPHVNLFLDKGEKKHEFV